MITIRPDGEQRYRVSDGQRSEWVEDVYLNSAKIDVDRVLHVPDGHVAFKDTTVSIVSSDFVKAVKEDNVFVGEPRDRSVRTPNHWEVGDEVTFNDKPGEIVEVHDDCLDALLYNISANELQKMR